MEVSNTDLDMSWEEERGACLTGRENKSLDDQNNSSSLDEDDDKTRPDDVIQRIGGCGKFQYVLAGTIQLMKLVVCWGMIGNTFLAFVPEWDCIVDGGGGSNTTVRNGSSPISPFYVVNSTGMDNKEKCAQQCSGYKFHGRLNTLVSEFDLVCDLSWVTATITSVQMAGMCLGSLISGHLSDAFGRKAPVFSSMTILFVCHLVSYFSVNWVMFAVCKFFIGVASAFFLTIYCTIQGEWALSRWRSVMIGFPSWAIESSLFALVAYLVPDWKVIALMLAAISLSYHAAWLWVPESFRWYITHDKYKEAEHAVGRVASWNKRRVPPDFKTMCKSLAAQTADDNAHRYTLITLFRNTVLLKLTLPLLVTWFTMGFVAYGINFGIKKLSGSIFLNLFVFSIASAPSKILSIWLQNKFGRRKAGIFAFSLCLIGGTVVGVAQHIDHKHKDTLTNAFALLASVGVDGAWGPLQTLTVEVYPTVIRNTGFGFHSILARLGAVVGPQFVYIGDHVPGIMYFMVGILSLSSIVCMMFLPETMDTNLIDRLTDDLEAHRTKEHKVSRSDYTDLPTSSSGSNE